MNNHNIIELHIPESLEPLQKVLKKGAQALLKQDIENELESRLAGNSALKIENGRQSIVRNG